MSRQMDEYKIVEMGTDAWGAIKDNPRQRNTELHAKKAIDWLRTPSIEHAVVHAARLRDTGDMVKLDGHTRAWLWERGEIPLPAKVHCILYAVDNLAAACDLYTHFDNARAAETVADQSFGAMNQVGFHPQSALLKNCKFISAVKYATVFELGFSATNGSQTIMLSPYTVIPHWKRELKILDTMEMPRARFPGPLMTAFLMSVRVRGAEITEFWARYRDEGGNRTGKTRDPVAALMEVVADKHRHGLATSKVFYRRTAQALACVEGHVTGTTYNGVPRGIRPETYMATTRNKYTIRSAA